MSYTIVRNIKANEDKTVTATSASNNIYPRHYSTETVDWPTSEGNPFKGKLGTEVEILHEYEKGNLQGGTNKFTRALEVLQHMPEYHKFDWQKNWEESQKNNGNEEYYQLLKRALETPLPTEKFVLRNEDGWYVSYREGAHSCRLHTDKKKAKLFNYADDAETLKKMFQNSQGWTIEQLSN